MRGALRNARRGVAAAVSVAMLVPAATLVTILLVGLVSQNGMSVRAAINQADLRAEDVKKFLRVSILRGPSNETLINFYAAGKLPIHVDYLMAVDRDGSVVAERDEVLLTLNPGDNITVTPSQLDPALADYDGDFWRMRREVRSLILHTSDGNTFHASWGLQAVAKAAVTVTRTGAGSTTTTYTTTTITTTVTVGG